MVSGHNNAINCLQVALSFQPLFLWQLQTSDGPCDTPSLEAVQQALEIDQTSPLLLAALSGSDRIGRLRQYAATTDDCIGQSTSAKLRAWFSAADFSAALASYNPMIPSCVAVGFSAPLLIEDIKSAFSLA
jgi:hypothetical protein